MHKLFLHNIIVLNVQTANNVLITRTHSVAYISEPKIGGISISKVITKTKICHIYGTYEFKLQKKERMFSHIPFSNSINPIFYVLLGELNSLKVGFQIISP